MNVLCTFSGARYDAITERVLADAPGFGADRVLVYDDIWMQAHPHWELNSWLWKHPGERFKDGTRQRRGLNWYAFKPVVMLDALDHASDGDVVFWLDGDSRPVSDMRPLFDVTARDGAMFFRALGHAQTTWCTRDCFVVMGDPAYSDKAEAAYGAPYPNEAGNARFFGMRKGPWKNRQFLYEWITYTVNPLATTFDPSELGPEPHGFEEHRTEQAVMTNLCHRYGYKLWRPADQDGDGSSVDRDVMPVNVFEQTRMGGGNIAGGSRFRNVEMPR